MSGRFVNMPPMSRHFVEKLPMRRHFVKKLHMSIPPSRRSRYVKGYSQKGIPAEVIGNEKGFPVTEVFRPGHDPSSLPQGIHPTHGKHPPYENRAGPTLHPTLPTHPSLHPTLHPTQPTHQTLHPTQPTHQTLQPTLHPSLPTHPSLHPTQPTHQTLHPTQPTHQTLQPTLHPSLHPTLHPTQHPTQPTHPTLPVNERCTGYRTNLKIIDDHLREQTQRANEMRGQLEHCLFLESEK